MIDRTLHSRTAAIEVRAAHGQECAESRGNYIWHFYLKPTQHSHPGQGIVYGCMVCRIDHRAHATDLGRRRAVRTTAEAAVSALYWIALLLTLGLFGYLLYAMLNAEKF